MLNVDEMIIIPEQPDDWTGHADGMVRFVDNNTVVINDYSKETDRSFVDELYGVLQAANLKITEIPTSMYDNNTEKNVLAINFARKPRSTTFLREERDMHNKATRE